MSFVVKQFFFYFIVVEAVDSVVSSVARWSLKKCQHKEDVVAPMVGKFIVTDH